MEQRCVGENAVKLRGRQIEMQEILLPDVAASRVTRHCNEALGAIEADRAMAECGEGHEVSPRPAAEIQNRKRRLDSIWCSSAAMFCVTSWSHVPSRKSSACAS